jgi:hypothetical protein
MDASSFKNMVGVGGMGEYDHDPLSKFFDTDRREVAAMLRRDREESPSVPVWAAELRITMQR